MFPINKNTFCVISFEFISLCLTGATVSASPVACADLNINQTKKISETEDPGYPVYNKSATTGSVKFAVTTSIGPCIYRYFVLDANSLSTELYLNKTLDLEKLYELGLRDTTLTIATTCTDPSGRTTVYTTAIVIQPVNEFPPHFIGEPFNVSIGEDTSVGDIVFSLEERTDDADFDIQSNKISRFEIHPYEESSVDGSQHFGVSGDVRKGKIALTKEVDFESLEKTGHTYFMINVSAEDKGYLMSTTTVNISVLNVDDLGPAFTLPGCDNAHTPTCSGYSSSVDNTYTGLLEVNPIAIEAVDLDNLGAIIIYTVQLVTPPKYKDYFSIDKKTGAIKVTNPLQDADGTVFLYLKATEDTPKQHSSMAYMTLTVRTSGGTIIPTGDGQSTEQSSTPNFGQSTEQSSISWKIFGVVLGACFLLIIAVAIVTFCVSKRFRTAISPGAVDSEEKVSHDEIQSRTTSTWPPSRSNSKQELIRNEYLNPIGKATQLPPISHQEEQVPIRPRRKKKNRPPEVFDGTQTYEGKADPQFYEDGTKRKIKRAPRSYENPDPKYWVTVPNDN